MGGLFSSLKPLPEVFIDLQNVTPNPGREQELYEKFNSSVIEPAAEIYAKFAAYQDGQKEATQAMVSPTQENKDLAWETILPNIHLQMEVYDFVNVVTSEFVKLVDVVLELSQETKTIFFADYPAVTKCFTLCFDMILKFDTQLLKLPKLVNDLAFFRRNAPLHNENNELDKLIESSNQTTVFWATQMPFLNKTIQALKAKYTQQPEILPSVYGTFGAVADVSTSIGIKSTNDELTVLCLRCMTGAILVYDALSPTGAFNKPEFHLKEGLEFLSTYEPKQSGLINFILYSSTTFDKPTTDPKYKMILNSK
jgi:hypothetical protein